MRSVHPAGPAFAPARRALAGFGAAVVLFGAGGTLTACGNDDRRERPHASGGPKAAPATRLMSALAQIEATGETSRNVVYTDLDALRSLAGGAAPDRSPYAPLMVGTGTVGQYARRIAGPTGIDAAQASEAYETGVPPRVVGRLNGRFDAGAIGAKLTALGFKPASEANDTWVANPDGDIDFEGPVAKLGLPPTGDLNAIRVDSGKGLTHARQVASLGMIPAPKGRAVLAVQPDFRAVGSCLGAVVAAQILRGEGEADLVGTGYQGRAAGEAREIMCVKVPGDANAALAKLKDTLSGGRSRTGKPWSELLPGAEATIAGPGVVRLTTRPGAPSTTRPGGPSAPGPRPGVLLRGALTGDLPDWRA